MATYSKPCSEVERMFLQIVNPQLSCMLGCHLDRLSVFLRGALKNGTGLAYFWHTVSKVAKEVSPPKAKIVQKPSDLNSLISSEHVDYIICLAPNECCCS